MRYCVNEQCFFVFYDKILEMGVGASFCIMACYTRESNFALSRSSKYNFEVCFVYLAAPYKFLPNIESFNAARTENCEWLVQLG